MIKELYRIDECPIPDKEKAKLEELLIQFGTVGNRVLTVREDVGNVLSTIKELCEYIIADSDCFEYQTEEDYRIIMNGVLWIRTALSSYGREQ